MTSKSVRNNLNEREQSTFEIILTAIKYRHLVCLHIAKLSQCNQERSLANLIAIITVKPQDAIFERLCGRIIAVFKNGNSFLLSLFIFWCFLELTAKEFLPEFIDLAYGQSSQAIFAKLTSS
jgi:hypothetical protein